VLIRGFDIRKTRILRPSSHIIFFGCAFNIPQSHSKSLVFCRLHCYVPLETHSFHKNEMGIQMPVYEYKALNTKGKQISGFIDAGNIKSAGSKLRNTNIYPISITEVDSSSSARNKKSFSFFNAKISIADTAIMTRQLSTLITAGFPLITALNTILPQIRKNSLKRILSKVKDSIEEGNSFANALGQYPGVFSSIYINMIRAGEASGTLGIVLERLADISEKQNRMNGKIKSALAYPVLMALIGTGVLFFLLTVIVPNITSIFEDMNHSLPFTTQVLISISHLLTQWWWAIAAFLLILVFCFNIIKKRPTIRTYIDSFVLKIPGIGELLKKIAVARFTRTLGALLENGVSLMKALDIVQNIVGNKVIEAAIIDAKKEVELGKELGKALDQASCMPYMSVQMIKVGERSGNLESMLKKTAIAYEEEIETTLTSVTALLEPMIILIMGVGVGFIVLSICLPIFEMNQLIN
jgi:general secretion pathway protein F